MVFRPARGIQKCAEDEEDCPSLAKCDDRLVVGEGAYFTEALKTSLTAGEDVLMPFFRRANSGEKTLSPPSMRVEKR